MKNDTTEIRKLTSEGVMKRKGNQQMFGIKMSGGQHLLDTNIGGQIFWWVKKIPIHID